MSLRTGSFCSGICAPEIAWRGLPFDPQFFSEIDPFASAVEAHHFPGVPNLGDMERVWAMLHFGAKRIRSGKATPNLKSIYVDLVRTLSRQDVWVAGTPCQSFSVAGLRHGLSDSRGNLTLVFLRIVLAMVRLRRQPTFIVWENVPGAISIDGGDVLRAILDAFEEAGYVVDIDVLDAQFFDVPQRRRRIFICAQTAKSILRGKTITSALTIAQCVAESLRFAFVVLSAQSNLGFESSASDVSNARDSLRRRIALFGLRGAEAVSMLRSSLDVLRRSYGCEPVDWDSASGRLGTAGSRNTGGTRSTESIAEMEAWRGECLNIGTSWSSTWADAFASLSECITSTSTSGTTESRIYTCARTALCIAAHITQSTDSSPTFWSAASSCLTALKAFTEYARSANSSLFTGVEWVQSWGDFLGQAQPAIDSFERLRVRGYADQILPLSDSLSGNPPPSREAAARASARVAGCLNSGGGNGGFRTEPGEHLAVYGGGLGGERSVAAALTAKAERLDFDTENFVTHSLRAEGFDASEDGTGRGTPIVVDTLTSNGDAHSGFRDERGLVPVAFDQFNQRLTGDIAGTMSGMRAGNRGPAVAYGIHSDALDRSGEGAAGNAAERAGLGISENLSPCLNAKRPNAVAIPFDTTQLTSAGNYSNPKPGDPCHPIAAGADAPAVAFSVQAAHRGVGQGHNTTYIPTAFQESQSGCREYPEAGTLRANGPGHDPVGTRLSTASGVRRLTPRECERLQGFPDDYTAIPYRGKPAADGPRYRALGNSMAVPVLRWIGERILAVEAIPVAKGNAHASR